MPASDDRRFLNRGEPAFDAGIFRISEDLALVQTVDFFTPVVDDPFIFGQIAAANSLSDVYAVGGEPLTAMNLVCFPCSKLDSQVLRDILLGGEDKIREAGAVMVGGHSVEDEEPKYGLAVTGTVHPLEMVTNSGAQPGQVLVLTKPLGTGLITTALKGQVISLREAATAVEGMKTLNRVAAAAMRKAGAAAATDITGFGLAGHAIELALASNVTVTINTEAIPVYDMAPELAREGFLPGGAYRNKKYFEKEADTAMIEPDSLQADLLWDPQTSGGLLVAVTPERLPLFQAELEKGGVKGTVVGKVIIKKNKHLILE